MIISLDLIYYLLGTLLLWIAYLTFIDRSNPKRFWAAFFWGIYAITFLCEYFISKRIMGVIVVVMAIIAGCGGVTGGVHVFTDIVSRLTKVERLKNKLFWPALIIPCVTVCGTLLLKNVQWGDLYLLDHNNVTLVSLGLACILAMVMAVSITGESVKQSVKEGHRLLDAIGWAAVLPQMLATLGGLFAVAGVGEAVSDLVASAIPVENRFVAACAYVFGMAIFTMIMGNAFAAFPVITAGVGLPLLVNMHGGNPAIMAAIGMFSGYCGTLMTPMAANYNIVPAALLDLKDRNGVIKVQCSTGIILLLINVGLLYVFMFYLTAS